MKTINFTKKSISFLMVFLLIFNTIIFSPLAFAESEAKFMVQNLLVDNAKNPIGNDNTTPKFSWNMYSDMRGQYQTAYRWQNKNGRNPWGAYANAEKSTVWYAPNPD